jgi:site-specific DNA-adenine methylase
VSDTAELIAAILAGEDAAEACQRIKGEREREAARAEYESAKANLQDLYELRAEGGFQNPVGKRRWPDMEAKAIARVETARQRVDSLGAGNP